MSQLVSPSTAVHAPQLVYTQLLNVTCRGTLWFAEPRVSACRDEGGARCRGATRLCCEPPAPSSGVTFRELYHIRAGPLGAGAVPIFCKWVGKGEAPEGLPWDGGFDGCL